MCLVMTNPVDILAIRHVKQGIEAGGFRSGHPSNYYLLLSNPYITLQQFLHSYPTRNMIGKDNL